jgi:hypothetical protein
MESTLKQDAPAATGASQTETVENRHMQPNYSMLESALQYAQRGWHIFPCRETPGEPYQDKKGKWITPREKTPYTANGLYDATIEPAKIQRWWKKWPGALIGVNCGKSGLFVIDLDTKHDKDGIGEFTRLGLDDVGALHSRTASGGLHIIFSGTGKNSTGKSGIDTRGEGGYFIAPPSVIIDGEYPGRYVALDDWTRTPGPLPAELQQALDALRPGKPKPGQIRTEGPARGKLSRATLEFLAHGAAEGQRNDRLFRAACDLAGNQYTQAEAEAMLLPVMLRVGTPETETQRTIESAYSRSRIPAIPQASQKSLSLDPADPFSDDTQPELFDVPIGSQPRYRVINSAFYAVEHDRDGGLKYRLLANWHASVTHEVARDDGQDIVRKMLVSGQLAGGASLPACEIDATSFASMNWVLQYWGTRAIIAAGQSTKDKLREAIQWASQDAIVSTVYTHTGWRIIDGRRVYLTTTGALGMDGIKVDLDGNLKRYALPGNMDQVDPKEAIRASLRFLQVAPPAVTFPLWGSMYLAPLAEIAPFDFLLWVFGETGSMKSTLCALALCHYGDFDHKHLPDGWGSTDNILEKQMFIAKDIPLIIDDFAPQASGVDAQNLDRKAARLIRAVGNHSPRNRMNADTSTRAGFMARGLVISTGEQLPTGQSVIARILPIEVLPKTVDIALLTQAQKEDARLYPYAMVGYLQWLIRNWDDIKVEYVQRHHEMRDSLRGTFHLRTPEMFAHLLMGVQLGLTYAVSEGAFSEPDAEAMLEQARAEMMKLAQAQGEHVRDELPAIKFINAIKALVAKGEYYIEGIAQPHADTAKWLGWADQDFYYLQSEITYNAVCDFLRKEGSVLGLRKKALNAQLVDKKFIMPGDRNTYTAYHKEKGALRTYAFFRPTFDG